MIIFRQFIMKLDLTKFYQTCNPAKTLVLGNAEDRKYYIDFSQVRGAKIIQELEDDESPHLNGQKIKEVFKYVGSAQTEVKQRLNFVFFLN